MLEIIESEDSPFRSGLLKVGQNYSMDRQLFIGEKCPLIS